MPVKPLYDWLQNQGPVILLLASALFFGYKRAILFISKLHRENKDAWATADTEREKRFEDLKERVNSSDKRHELCEQQKISQQEQIFQMALMIGDPKAMQIFKSKDPSTVG